MIGIYVSKFSNGLAIGFGIIIAFVLAILAGACVLYLMTNTTWLDPVFKFFNIY